MVPVDNDVILFGMILKVLMNILFLNGFMNINMFVVQITEIIFGEDLLENTRLYVALPWMFKTTLLFDFGN